MMLALHRPKNEIVYENKNSIDMVSPAVQLKEALAE